MKKGKSFIRKSISVVLALSIITSVSLSTVVNGARTLDDIKNEQAALEEKQAELQSQLDILDSEKQDSLEYKETLMAQISSIEEQIDSANAGIKELDQSISVLTEKLGESEDKYSDTLELLKERIKVLYTSGGISTLQILLSSESFTDYSMKSELMKSVTAHDKELMEKISAYMKETEDDRNQLKEEKAEVANLKKTLETKTAELEKLNSENDAVISNISSNQDKTMSAIQEGNAYGDELANEMAGLIEQMRNEEAERRATPIPTATPRPTPEPTATPEPTPEPTALPTPSPTPEPEENYDEDGNLEPVATPTPIPELEYPEPEPTPEPTPEPEPEYTEPEYEDNSTQDYGISFQWPCPGYSYISAGWMGYEGHKGLDMAAAYGTPIYAAESGTVMVANDYDSWGYSWGYYVSIYHNYTYSTLYAHCSSIAVSAGQQVEKGQLIGYVGSTGNSTGNHLHFEVYQDGTRVDPAQFF